MASIVNTNSQAHNIVVQQAEGVRQSAVAAASGNRATINSADVTFYRTICRSALTSGVSPASAMQALRELGVTGL
jgi:hypothetical protein